MSKKILYKTPLRYPGGKSRAMKDILDRLPEEITEFRDVFVGGGSVFIKVKEKYPDAKIWINDAYGHLYVFWKVLRDDPKDLISKLTELKGKHQTVINGKDMTITEVKSYQKNLIQDNPRAQDLLKDIATLKDAIPSLNDVSRAEELKAVMSPWVKAYKSEVKKNEDWESWTKKARELYLSCRKDIDGNSIDNITRAAYFYIINKCSFSGLTENGTFSAQASVQNFSLQGIEKLASIAPILKGATITNNDYRECFKGASKGTLVFMDPPYDLGKQNSMLYGANGELHKSFNHDEFAKDCDKIGSKFLITYNNSEKNLERFENHKCEPWSVKYGMRIVENKDGDLKAKESLNNELFISNYDHAALAQKRKKEREEKERQRKKKR